MVGSKPDKITRSEIESLLSRVMIPVEPDERFVRRLQARLVRVEGGWFSTGWTIIGSVAIATVLLMAMFGMALRLFLGLLSVIGLLERRSSNQTGSQISPA